MKLPTMKSPGPGWASPCTDPDSYAGTDTRTPASNHHCNALQRKSELWVWEVKVRVRRGIIIRVKMNCKSLRGKSKSKERYYKKSKSELREFGNQLWECVSGITSCSSNTNSLLWSFGSRPFRWVCGISKIIQKLLKDAFLCQLFLDYAAGLITK